MEKPTKHSIAKTRNRSARSPSEDHLPAYERFGRIDILEGGLAGSPFVEVNVLANLAQHQLDIGHEENAANLLRAAEHLSFAALAPRESARLISAIPGELKDAVAVELGRLTRTAEDLWSEAGATNRTVIESIYVGALEQARLAFERGAYRPALQLARAAEALAQVHEGLPTSLPADRALTHRIAS